MSQPRQEEEYEDDHEDEGEEIEEGEDAEEGESELHTMTLHSICAGGLGHDPRGLVPCAKACLLAIRMGYGHGSCHSSVSAKAWAVDAAASFRHALERWTAHVQ